MEKKSIRQIKRVITDVTKGTTYQAEPFPPFIKDMIARGGLMASLKAKEAAK